MSKRRKKGLDRWLLRAFRRRQRVVTVRERAGGLLAPDDPGSVLPGSRARRSPVGALPVRGRRRPWLVALGVLLACLGALGVVWLVGAAGQRQEVLVVRQELAYGDVITASDVGIVRVSVDPGVDVMVAARRSEVVGLVAATRLTPGMLLNEQSVSSHSGPTAGQVLVPVALAADRMPAGGLQPGDRIMAVVTRSEQAPGVPIQAQVVRVGPMDVNGVSVVDVTTQTGQGPRLTVAASEGAIAIVVQPSGG